MYKILPRSGNPFMDEAKEKDKAIEIRIYHRLGDHPYICKYIREDKNGIVLERLRENLRKYPQRLLRDAKTVGFDQAVMWSRQVAESVAYIHSEIPQGDVGCHNLLLDGHNNLKFCDFAGSSIDGEDPTVCCNTRYQPYTDDSTYPVTTSTELFGLGSIPYEIWTGSLPYQDESDEDVNDYFRKSKFPDVENLPPASIISKCWRGSCANVAEVVKDSCTSPSSAIENETKNRGRRYKLFTSCVASHRASLEHRYTLHHNSRCLFLAPSINSVIILVFESIVWW